MTSTEGERAQVGSYELLETLGKGAFATVHLARHLITEEKVAIKIVDKRLITDDYVSKNLHREAAILSHLFHPNVIKLLEVFETESLYCLVTERAKVDLLQHLCSRGVYSEQQARKYIRQLISAVDHLHRNGIVHRDLKMENLMLDQDLNLKLIDFGLSNDMTGKTALETQCGSMAYSAPELLCKKPYGKEVDIWSVGVCLYVLLTGKLPFPSDRLTELHALMLDGSYTIPEDFSPALRDLMGRFFQVKPHKRISLEELATHEWIVMGDVSLGPLLGVTNGPIQLAEIQVSVVQQMVRMGVDSEAEITHSILRNACNTASATYHLLISRSRRLARERRRTSKDVDETGGPLARSISQKSLASPSSTGRRSSLRRSSESQPDDAVTPRRPPSSRPEDSARRNSMSTERRMSVGRRGSRVSPGDHVEHAEEDTGVRRMSFKAEDPRRSRTSMPLPPNRINQDVYADALEVMSLCVTHRDGEWERQLERATHRALMTATTNDLLAVLRSHGWDGLHFRSLREPLLFAEQLEGLLRSHAAQEQSSSSPSHVGSPGESLRQVSHDSLSSESTPLRSRFPRDMHGLALFQDGDDYFGFDVTDLEASHASMTAPGTPHTQTPRSSRPSSALGSAPLPPINAGPPSTRSRPVHVSTEVDHDVSKPPLRRVQSSGMIHDLRRVPDSRLVPPPSSHTSRPSTAAAPLPARPISPSVMPRGSFSMPLSSGSIKFKRT